MKILYDHLCFWERFGGVSKYFVELIKRIPPNERVVSLRYTNNNEYISSVNDIKTTSLLGKYDFRGKPRVVKEVGKLFSIPKLIGGKYDIYHPTHYDTYGLSLAPKHVKKVTTIHDLNYFRIPDLYNKRSNDLIRHQIKMANSVDYIITISENTKRDIIDIWNINPQNISVIHHGIDKEIARTSLPSLHQRPYILYVGRRSKYKNFTALAKAVATLPDSFNDIDLVCAGTPFTPDEKASFEKLGILNRCFAYPASERELYQLYQHAKLFIFPSFYEGFGMPILEAMASSCPIAISNTSCFPEIAKDAALYFDPNSPEEIADTIKSVIDSTELRQSLIKKGNLRVEDFSWDKCAQMHLDVYKSII